MTAGPAAIEMFRLPALPEGLPFPSAVRAGGLVFVSGQIGHRPGENRLVEGGIEPEMRQAMGYLQAALEMAGSSLGRVVRCTLYLTDLARDFETVDALYRDCFPRHLPARTAVEVRALALGARIEIDCIALAGD